jgi:hypothetical protein
MFLDPSGGDWKSEVVPRRVPVGGKTGYCEMVLTKDVAYAGQLYNCYREVDNPGLLAKYGFIARKNGLDRVCLREYVWGGDEVVLSGVSFVDEERRKYWKQNGRHLLLRHSKEGSYLSIEETEFVAKWSALEDEAWVDWSLSLYIPFGRLTLRKGLDLWAMMCVIDSFQWNNFVQAESPYDYLAGLFQLGYDGKFTKENWEFNSDIFLRNARFTLQKIKLQFFATRRRMQELRQVIGAYRRNSRVTRVHLLLTRLM